MLGIFLNQLVMGSGMGPCSQLFSLLSVSQAIPYVLDLIVTVLHGGSFEEHRTIRTGVDGFM